MRKFVDTVVLVFLLIGPAVILTCVRQPDGELEQITQEDTLQEDLESERDVLVWNEPIPRP